MKTQYVAGLYSADQGRFMLFLRKKKPGHWQDGRHNLLGGHIEPDESPKDAMVREFFEEAGVRTNPNAWNLKLVLSGPTWVVHFFHMEGTTQQTIMVDHAEGTNEWHADIPKTAIPNLHWIVPMMLDKTILFPIHVQDSK